MNLRFTKEPSLQSVATRDLCRSQPIYELSPIGGERKGDHHPSTVIPQPFLGCSMDLAFRRPVVSLVLLLSPEIRLRLRNAQIYLTL